MSLFTVITFFNVPTFFTVTAFLTVPNFFTVITFFVVNTFFAVITTKRHLVSGGGGDTSSIYPLDGGHSPTRRWSERTVWQIWYRSPIGLVCLRHRYSQQLLSLIFPRCRFVYSHTYLTILSHSIHVCFVSTSEIFYQLQLRPVR